MTIKRHFVLTESGRRVHYRRTGDGPPLVMLHPSPSSSYGQQPRMLDFAKAHTVIALDNPGYGESAQLPLDHPEIRDYADAMCETLDALNLPKVDLWGTHTGASIALEFAARRPERVRRLVLDGLTMYKPHEREDNLKYYTPDMSPQWDAGHLLRGWYFLRDMRTFSPWYKKDPAHRIHRPLPTPEQLHFIYVDFLRAGIDYWKGYKAAFAYDTFEGLQNVQVPTLLTASLGDTLRKQLDRAENMPSGITVMAAGDDAGHVRGILEFLEGDPLPAAPPPAPVRSPAGVVRRDFIETSLGQLLMRRCDGGDGRPLVLLHAMPGTSAHYERLMPHFARGRDVVTFDLPGNGDSAAFPEPPAIADFARVILEAIDTLGFNEFDLYGAHTGALISMEISIARPEQVKHVLLDGITLFSDEYVRDVLEHYSPPIVPTTEGSHLIWAWNFRRDMMLWWPWYDYTLNGLRPTGAVPSPEAQHAGFVEFMKGALTYHLAYRAAFSYPTRERLPLVPAPIFHLSSESDPLRSCLPEAKQLTPHAAVRVHRGTATPDALAETMRLYHAFMEDQPLPPGPEE